jgi:hypothetical protein
MVVAVVAPVTRYAQGSMTGIVKRHRDDLAQLP